MSEGAGCPHGSSTLQREMFSDLLPSPSSVTPSTRRSRHCACFLSFSNTSAYPGRRRNRPNAASEWAGMGDMDCTEDEDEEEEDCDCCLFTGGGSAAADSGASYTSSPDCSMVTHSNWSLSLDFSWLDAGISGALTWEEDPAEQKLSRGLNTWLITACGLTQSQWIYCTKELLYLISITNFLQLLTRTLAKMNTNGYLFVRL